MGKLTFCILFGFFNTQLKVNILVSVFWLTWRVKMGGSGVVVGVWAVISTAHIPWPNAAILIYNRTENTVNGWNALLGSARMNVPLQLTDGTWGALRCGLGFHTGFLGNGQCVVGGLGGAGAGGTVSPQQALHVIQLRPCEKQNVMTGF